MATIRVKRGLQAMVDNLVLAQGEIAIALDTGNLYIGTMSGNVHVNPPGGTADVAVKLQTPRAISIIGDGTAQAINFDGTGNVQLQLVLANIASLSAGTYTKVTVDAKGRVTAGATLEVSDVPTLPHTKISGLGTAATVNTGTGQGNVPVIQADGKLLTSLIPDLSGTYVPVTTTINGHPLREAIALTAEDVEAIPVGQKGVAGGVAELDSTGKVPSTQLPSFVDDVEEYEDRTSFPETGEAGKIYVATDTNITYRWGGSTYVEISPSIALGETSSTAYRGDRGKTAYDHSQATGNAHNATPADIGAAPAAHVTTIASAATAAHVKPGEGMSVGEDGTLNLDTIDGGVF